MKQGQIRGNRGSIAEGAIKPHNIGWCFSSCRRDETDLGRFLRAKRKDEIIQQRILGSMENPPPPIATI